MIAPKEPLLRSIAAMQSAVHFQSFLEHLRQSLDAVTSNLVDCRSVEDICVLQGRARELQEIISSCEDASQHIKAIERHHQISSEHLT